MSERAVQQIATLEAGNALVLGKSQFAALYEMAKGTYLTLSYKRNEASE